ncbi:polysaccharide deacetylase family protein [Clostridium sp. C8-1-8]|uniref:polysaccharide deacetylase family protein n=1 Tax=Clostridium sp. C8-1-8 TaxID=2698831 RepID=UPI001371364F|nr:polysaccharide deacetylase family protein [Clostridium sp. C8-1-8]
MNLFKKFSKKKNMRLLPLIIIIILSTSLIYLCYKRTNYKNKVEPLTIETSENTNTKVSDRVSDQHDNNKSHDKENGQDQKAPLTNVAIPPASDPPAHPDTSSNKFDASMIHDYLVKNKKKSDGKKVAFLTFDDGPSTTVTPRILKILNDNGIKATFFIVGKQLDLYPDSKKILMDTYAQGNSIGNHTYDHDPIKLYPKTNVDAKYFMEDIKKNEEVLKSVLGDHFHTKVIRFPGGHKTWHKTAEVDKMLNKEGFFFIDWNDMTSDAEGSPKSRKELFNRYKQTFGGQDKVVILMHDSFGKDTTADALPDIIDDLKNKGYEFGTLV